MLTMAGISREAASTWWVQTHVDLCHWETQGLHDIGEEASGAGHFTWLLSMRPGHLLEHARKTVVLQVSNEAH